MLRRLGIGFALLWALCLLAGCGGAGVSDVGDGNPTGPAKPQIDGDRGVSADMDPTDCDPVWRWAMIFGYGNPADGENHFWASAELVQVDGQWYMKYSVLDGYGDWMFCDAHVEIWGQDEGSGPPKGAPGKFEYKWDSEGDYDAMVAWNADGLLPLGDFDPTVGDPCDYYFAIHGTVCTGHWETDPYTGEEYWVEDANETGWGGYWDKIDGTGDWDGYWKKWGGWVGTGSDKGYPLFDHFGAWYSAQSPLAPPYPYWYSYWKCSFNAPGPLPPFDDAPHFAFPGLNPFPGWCVDPKTWGGNSSQVTVYSSYDPGMPAFAQSANWDYINYLVAMRNKGEGLYNVNWYNNYQHFQNAIWYFKYGYGSAGGALPAAGTLGRALVDDALANGDNFVPLAGEYYAVAMVPTLDASGYSTYQMNIIEVDP